MSDKNPKIHIDRRKKSSDFERILSEVDAEEIPAEFIEYISIHYADGSVIEILGSEIAYPVPIRRNEKWKRLETNNRKISDLKVYVNLQKLEREINKVVSKWTADFIDKN